MVLKAQAPRTALMKLLDSILDSSVLYLHAPAGFGKTMSALLWLEHREKQAPVKQAWLSLDNHDNKTSDFCRRFAAALSGLQPENAALRELAAHPGFNTAPVEFAMRAPGAFTAPQTPCFLVIDDLHIINNTEILTVLPCLLKRLPKNCVVMLLSRNAPPDSFSEMVIKGGLSVVDAAYLQFTNGEIKIFFNKSGRDITNKQAEEIFLSTGGWAIALRALLLSEKKSYSIDLTGQYLENFLKTHVWERWDESTRKFLTLVSVCPELTPELCEQLTAADKLLKKSNSAQILSGLARENAFLRETENNTYRFHDLFRDFLLHMLEESGAQEAAGQYNRAGDYYFGKQDYFRAAEYYLNGKNDDGMARCLYHMYDYNSVSASIEDTLYIIHKAISDSAVEKHPFLLEVQAWAAFVEGRPDDFESYLDRYYKLLPKIILKNPRSVITGILLRCIDYREPYNHIMKSVGRIPLKGIVNLKAFTPSITNNQPYWHRSVRDFSELFADLDKSTALFEKGIGTIIGEEFAVIKECLYAGCHYEKGNLSDACRHALTACGNIPDDCSAEIRFCAMMMLASALYADGQEEDAEEVLGNIRGMIERDKAFYLKPNLRAYLCRLKLADGDISAARDWLKAHKKIFDSNLSMFKMYQYSSTARAHIVMGEYTAAILLLQKLLLLSEQYRRPLDVIECCILLAVAYWKKGKGGLSVAMDYIEQSVRTAQEYGYKQQFANEGAELVNILHRLYKRTVQKDYAGGVSSMFAKTLYVLALSESKRTKGLTGGRSPKNLTFTDRQKAVMRLMCEGHSKKGIAEKMGLKPSGVKTHTDLIYKKLGVGNSVEAIMKIKELGLLAM
ncbi:MAG: LuxR C-terminal-related transcriptional regulator [Oscillospiraceae bacterium]|nr:LuxR C-terminal-related transcriptional regulator [Oscillospiraceae bacterium]